MKNVTQFCIINPYTPTGHLAVGCRAVADLWPPPSKRLTAFTSYSKLITLSFHQIHVRIFCVVCFSMLCFSPSLSHCSSVAPEVTLSVCWSVSPPLWSRLKYLSNCWMDCHEILYRHSWSPEDEFC